MNIIFPVYVFVSAVTDFTKRTVSLALSILFAIAAFLFMAYAGFKGENLCGRVLSGFFGMLPGIGVIICSKLTKGAIGEGDGIFLAAAGVYLGAADICMTFFCGLFLSMIWALAAILTGARSLRRRGIPFVTVLAVIIWIRRGF